MKFKNLLISLLAVGTMYGQSIVNSVHDFSTNTWNNSGEICTPCHTPHNANVNKPLWNHETSQAAYTIYNSNTLDATAGQPDGESKLCLGCHDGTVALDSYGGANGLNYISNDLGTDISNDHPISIVYDAVLSIADGGLYDPSLNSGMGGSIDSDMLYGNKVQCTSCHDVHNGTGLTKLLIKDNAASALCLTCHDK